jgi:predicted dehydrogenase
VAVDSPRHHAVGLQVLRADRHLLVEKPMALTVADARELNTLADKRGRVLAVDHLLLHHPGIRRARQLLADGALGRPLWLEATRFATGAVRGGQSVWWSLAPHDVSLALYLFDAVPMAVTAVGGSTFPEQGGDDTVVWATLHFDDGRLAHVRVARQAAEKQRQFSIAGDRGALVFDELASDRALRVQVGTGGERVEIVPVTGTDPLSAQCRQFVAGVSRDDPTAGNGAHALAVVRVLEAGSQSMRAGGAPVRLA